MRHAEARDLRSFLGEPVEEVVMEGRGEDDEDITLQQTRPDVAPGPDSSQRLRPYRIQRYQSRGVALALAPSTSETLRLHSSKTERPPRVPDDGERVTGQLAPLAAIEPKRWHELYVWLVLVVLFLLVVLGGIGLDSLIASYRW